MFKYIGIRGHRGSGKNTISYLLGTAINYLMIHKSWDNFETTYEYAVHHIMSGDDVFSDHNLKYIYFEAFSDEPKILLSQLIGVKPSSLYNDWVKDSMIVNLKDFSYTQSKDKLELHAKLDRLHPYTAKTLKEAVDKDPNLLQNDTYIVLRELIIYYSKYVMQHYFGKNVWIKAREVNDWKEESFYGNDYKTIYKIFTDCKFPSEISYIKDKSGVIVNICRPDNVKNDTEITNELAEDNRIDFEIELTTSNLFDYSIMNSIKLLTEKIINNDQRNCNI